jgi:hypothetical protein
VRAAPIARSSGRGGTHRGRKAAVFWSKSGEVAACLRPRADNR